MLNKHLSNDELAEEQKKMREIVLFFGHRNKFDVLNQILKSVSICYENEDVMLTWINLTAPYARHLDYRDHYIERVRSQLSNNAANRVNKRVGAVI